MKEPIGTTHKGTTQCAVCMKWGKRYPADYVNRLYSMLQRHTTRPTELVCYTDDASGLDPAIRVQQLPDVPIGEPYCWAGWRKLAIWNRDITGISGEVVFFDIDLVITDCVDELWDYAPGELCIIENWTQKGRNIGNSSVFKFVVGQHHQIWQRFCADPISAIAEYDNEQIFLCRMAEKLTFWPAPWCLSFKHSILPRWPANLWQEPRLPKGTKIVAFTGKPDPDEARDGMWPAPFWKKIYRQVRKTPWIAEHWR